YADRGGTARSSRIRRLAERERHATSRSGRIARDERQVEQGRGQLREMGDGTSSERPLFGEPHEESVDCGSLLLNIGGKRRCAFRLALENGNGLSRHRLSKAVHRPHRYVSSSVA